MIRPFPRHYSATLLTAALFALGACASTERVTAPGVRRASGLISTAAMSSTGVVISQVYGGGGNSGATYKNDFIEIFNAGGAAVSLSGWSVQYASSAGTTWQVTNLPGVSLQPGQYLLVQEAQGAGGTTNLPTPDATGTIAMSATAGKVALVNATAALSGACPTAGVQDFVGFGTAATCSETAPTATLSNTTAARRNNGGLTDSDNNAGDFTVIPMNATTNVARNTQSPFNTTAGPVVSVIVSPNPASVQATSTVALSAVGKDANNVTSPTTFTWSSSNPSIATINATTGVATGVAPGSVTISATSANNVTGTGTLNVTPAPGGVVTVTVAPSTASVANGATTPLTAAAFDINGTPVSSSFTWSSSDPSIATVNATTGVVTGVSVGGPVTITATTPNSVSGSAQITVTPKTITQIRFSSSGTSFPPGFQTQLFLAAVATTTTDTVKSIFTVRSLDPAIADIYTYLNTGIITGVGGSASRPRFEIVATPIGGGAAFTDTLTPVTIEFPVFSAPGTFGINDEFGRPTAAGLSTTDFLISRPQYTLSYNQSRGTPNWVSYELDIRHMVTGADRCNCFSGDPLVPQSAQILTADYTNGGFDRGHMARSFDRTTSNTDNASTFYTTNIVPQTGDLNQGVWANFENALGDSARIGGRAVYIITGPLYASGAAPRFVNNAGKIQIPDSTWKVAIIGSYSAGNPFTRSNIVTWNDLANTTVLAVNMPNVAGIRNVPWQTYLTTVDKIEASTGYNFLSLLQSAYQTAVEAGDRPPVASFTGPTSGLEGGALAFNGSASTDPDLLVSGFGEVLTYGWTFGDGTTSTLVSPTKTYVDNGTYAVTLTVTDKFGWPRSTTRAVTVSNAAPVATLTAQTASTVRVGQSVTFGASGTDAGIKDFAWTLSYDFGDGTTYNGTVTALPTAGRPLLRAKSWSVPGTYIVQLTIRDKDGATGSSSVTVTVTP